MSPLRTIQLLTRVTAGLLVAGPLVAQQPKRVPARPDSTREAAEPNDPALPALHWRLVGPFRGGRAAAAAGGSRPAPGFRLGAGGRGAGETHAGGRAWDHAARRRAPPPPPRGRPRS